MVPRTNGAQPARLLVNGTIGHISGHIAGHGNECDLGADVNGRDKKEVLLQARENVSLVHLARDQRNPSQRRPQPEPWDPFYLKLLFLIHL